MTLESVDSFPPVAQTEHPDRLAALPARPADDPEFWTKVHDKVQEQLVPLETEVRRKLAGVRVAAGRTKGDTFFLFSYRTFSMPDSALDPVVVGMTFTPAPQGVTVEADVSGEQMGDRILAVPGKTVSTDEVLSAAQALARELCQSAEAIAAALQDPTRGFE